jgi:two-component system sensor histidine kinase TctE
MRSLRAQLAFWILLPLLVVWGLNAWLSYQNAVESANRAYDRTLLGSVLAIAERVSVAEGEIVVDLPYSSLEMLESNLQSRVYYRVSLANGRHITGYEGLRRPTAKLELGKPLFYDSEYLGERVRVAAMAKRLYDPAVKDPILIQVAETGELRDSMSWKIVTESAAKDLLLILLAAALMWVALNRGLRPLYELRRQISRRSRTDLSRMDAGVVPTELQPLIEAINDHTAQVARVTSAQKQFVSDAAHQLKTPLSVLRAQADFASKQEDLAGVNEVLDDMRAGASRVSHLVDQLLALSRAEAAAPAFVDLDLEDFARATTFEWLALALAKPVDLGFEGEGPVAIKGNKVLLHELVANLLDNAIRFAPARGRVTVRVSRRGDRAVLAVEDNGPGIPEAERSRIFDRFYQIGGGDSQGCGLGLAITREIATLHGAVVSAHAPESGPGALFEVEFKFAEVQRMGPATLELSGGFAVRSNDRPDARSFPVKY